MARFSDFVKIPEGIFTLKQYGLDGKLLDVYEGENIVVNDGREALARLVANDGGQDWYITHMKFGDGGHDPGDPTVMLAVDVTDADLYGTIHISKAISVAHPGLRQVAFNAVVGVGEGNGAGVLEYSEAGLYFNAGTEMFAHKAFGYVVKNDTIQLDATWTFTF